MQLSNEIRGAVEYLEHVLIRERDRFADSPETPENDDIYNNLEDSVTDILNIKEMLL